MNHSWYRTSRILLISVLILSGIFFAITSFNYEYKMKNTIIEENSNVANLWSSSIESRLNSIYEHIYDTFVFVFNSTELRSGSPTMSNIVNKKIVDSMENKFLSNNDMDALFVYDTESNMFLYVGSNNIDVSRNVLLKKSLKENLMDYEVTSLSNKSWTIVTINDVDYFYKGIKLGKYLAGAVSNIARYNIGSSFNALGEDISCFVCHDDVIYFAGGNRALEELLDINNLKNGFVGDYALSKNQMQYSESTVILMAKPQSFFEGNDITRITLIICSALCIMCVVVLIRYSKHKIAEPTRMLIEANKQVAEGHLDTRLDAQNSGSREFYDLFTSFNDMCSQIDELTSEKYNLVVKEEKNKLQLLRAQIRPHTFLNTLTTINNMTYRNTPEEIRKYITTFAKFTRYMLNTSSEITTLKEELEHIENYISIQKNRTSVPIHLTIDTDEQLQDEKIPFLLLFTLVENSLKHSIIEQRTLEIKITASNILKDGEEMLRITEEDNGDGFTKESIEKLFAEEEPFTKKHLGLTNVRFTLNLMYHRNDLMTIYNKESGGAVVEVLIPKGEKCKNKF